MPETTTTDVHTQPESGAPGATADEALVEESLVEEV
jgi:hypothetical protein